MGYAQNIWDLLQNKKTHVYMCGLKGMESGMEEALGPIAESQGIVWKLFVKMLKKEHGRFDVANVPLLVFVLDFGSPDVDAHISFFFQSCPERKKSAPYFG